MRRCVNRWHGGTIGGHSLSHALAGVPAPSGREPGLGAYHSIGYSLKSGVTGDFHRPYETQKILGFTIQRAARSSDFFHFTIHRGTLPQSRPLGVTAPSGREPGWGAYHSSGYLRNRRVTGDFHRPYEGSEYFTFHHTTDRPKKSSGFHPGTIPGGAGHPRMGTSLMRN